MDELSVSEASRVLGCSIERGSTLLRDRGLLVDGRVIADRTAIESLAMEHLDPWARTDDPDSYWMTSGQAARTLRVPVGRVRALITQGRVPSLTHSGPAQTPLVRRRDVDAVGQGAAAVVDLPGPSTMTRLRRRAAAGDPDAMCRLGEVYREHGDPDEVDQIEGLWRRAASAGHPAAMLHLADLLRELVDEAEDGGEDDLHLEDHLTWYQRAARQGNVEAMTALAWELYFFGDDEPGTLAEAKNWWRAAAEAGSPTAMSLLGTTAHDPHEEERWLRRAATQHDTTAMYNLGSLLASRDDPASVAEGHAWWRRAAEAGSVEAMRQLSRLLRERGDQGSLREADEWEHRAADEKEPSEVSIAAAAQELGCDKQAARRVLAAHDLLVGARVTATWEELELLAIELEIRAMELDSPDNGADDEPNS